MLSFGWAFFFVFLGVSLAEAFPAARVGQIWAPLRFGASHGSLRSPPPHPSREINPTS